MENPPTTGNLTGIPGSESEQDNILHLVFDAYSTYVRPYLWLDLLAIVLFLIGGVIYLKTTVPLFRSKAQLHVNSQDLKVTDMRGVMDPNYQSGETFINTQMLLMKSSEILKKANQLSGVKESYRGPIVKRVPGTMLVDLAVESANPDVAAKMANSIAEVYLDSVRSRKVEITYTGMNLLRDQMEELRKSRELAMNDMLKFKEEHQIFNFSENYAAIVSQINSLNNIANEARLDETELASTLESIRENRANAVRLMPYLIPLGSDAGGSLGSLKMLYFSHETTLPALLSQYNEAHTAVKTHREVSQMLKEAQEAEVDTSIDGLELRYKRSKKRRELLDEQIAVLRAQLTELDKISADYRMHETALTSLDNTYSMLVNRINEIKISNAATSVDTSSIFLVSPAFRAEAAFFPDPFKVFKLALLLGVAAAAALSYILGSVNNKIASVEEVNAIFNHKLPFFGHVPLFEQDELELLKSQGDAMIDEVFRNIRTSLNLSMLTKGSKTLAISSPLPKDGKTFIALNLARSFARDKKKVLLMGLDLRKPRLDKLIEPYLDQGRKHRGISNVLVGDCKLSDVVLRLEQFNLDLALSGPVPPNPNELLSSGGLQEILAEATA
ncbi:MAG: hypothetical protein PHG44_05265, partial [Lentisphaeria bacterium]|nr:hypothetical protein [Lentisphaeria bacterium]